MGKKDKPPPTPRATPKKGGGKRCPTCNQPLGQHSVKQLVDCLASQN